MNWAELQLLQTLRLWCRILKCSSVSSSKTTPIDSDLHGHLVVNNWTEAQEKKSDSQGRHSLLDWLMCLWGILPSRSNVGSEIDRAGSWKKGGRGPMCLLCYPTISNWSPYKSHWHWHQRLTATFSSTSSSLCPTPGRVLTIRWIELHRSRRWLCFPHHGSSTVVVDW